MSDQFKIVEDYIKRQEKFYGRSLRPFNKFLLRDFAKKIIDYVPIPDAKVIRKEKSVLPTGNIKVAFISEEIGHLTGGRYYAWFMACALVELGFDVTFYTNQEPAYAEAFKEYTLPKIQIVAKADIETLDVNADIYVSSPLHGNFAVVNMREKYRRPSFVMIFDPSPTMKKYLGTTFLGWEKLAAKIRKSDVHILSLCNSTSKDMPEWLNKREDQISPIYPCINSRILNKVPPKDREDYVVFISRLVKHKKIDHVLEAVKKNDIKLKIISSNDGIGIQNLIKQYKLEGKVDLHLRVTDEEKFKIISGARAVINGSHFEGFGMWAIEAFATGTPLVAYEFPTIREIKEFSKADNFYLADWGKPESLTEQLKLCLSENKIGDRSHIFDFDAMVQRVKDVISPEPKIGVITIALNEEKFIGASLRSVIKHKNVAQVAVVEGAVNLFSHAAGPDGLSLDQTREQVLEVMKREDGKKIIYERYGWAVDKSELRNRALSFFKKEITHVLVVDADEVWKSEDIDRLVEAMKLNPRTGVFLFDFYHFWKFPTLRAVGGQWDSQMFRCFRFADKTMHWKHHGAPVIDVNGDMITITEGTMVVPNVHVYHYGAMKEQQRILEKLEFYSKRDKHLKVKDTWSDWKPGQETQWTHGGGDVVQFDGTHPEEVAGLI